MKSLFSALPRLSTYLGLAIVSTVSAELPQLKLVNAYPNLKLQRPLWLEQLSDGRMFVLEQRGKIHVLPKNSKGSKTKLFFDIEARKPYVKDEEGLLGMAFHPQHAENGKFYVFWRSLCYYWIVLGKCDLWERKKPENWEADVICIFRVWFNCLRIEKVN